MCLNPLNSVLLSIVYYLFNYVDKRFPLLSGNIPILRALRNQEAIQSVTINPVYPGNLYNSALTSMVFEGKTQNLAEIAGRFHNFP